jgi:hypothetical protein
VFEGYLRGGWTFTNIPDVVRIDVFVRQFYPVLDIETKIDYRQKSESGDAYRCKQVIDAVGLDVFHG